MRTSFFFLSEEIKAAMLAMLHVRSLPELCVLDEFSVLDRLAASRGAPTAGPPRLFGPTIALVPHGAGPRLDVVATRISLVPASSAAVNSRPHGMDSR